MEYKKLSTDTQSSNAEAEQAGTKEVVRKDRFLNPKMLKRTFKVLIFGLKIYRLGAKLWEWFL